MSEILTYEEIERIIRAAAGLGIRKIKITGGEPFVRLGCTSLIRNIKGIDGIEEVTVTTNGQSLERYIDELKDIGIDGINISLDTLDPERYRNITGGGDPERTLKAVDLAAASGIRTKVNCIPMAGFNEDEFCRFAELAFGKNIAVRFIEMMPVGAGDPEVGISNEEVLGILMNRWPGLESNDSVCGNGPAVYYRLPGSQGNIGFISAINGIFCSSCNRVRLTSTGQIKPCLCYENRTDLRPYLSKSDAELKEAIRGAIFSKPEAHCFGSLRPDAAGQVKQRENRLMSQIGG